MNYYFSVPYQFTGIDIEHVNAISGDEMNGSTRIQIPSQNEASCVDINFFASHLILTLTNFELAPCMKVVVYGYPQQTCEKPSDDVCAKTYHADNSELVFKEDKCELSCLDGFTGDPYDNCYPPSPDYGYDPYAPPVNIPIGAYDPPTGRPECLVNSDCNNTLACGPGYTCYDPCEGSCGLNASCAVINHRPTCSCLGSLVGDPYTGCFPSQPFVDPCEPNPCGRGALPLRSTGRCDCFCPYPSSKGYQPDLIPHYTECRPECVVTSDCPPNLSCRDHVCQDPCTSTCGRGATCTVVNHSPMCSCPPGDAGNPLVQCQYPAPDYSDYAAPASEPMYDGPYNTVSEEKCKEVYDFNGELREVCSDAADDYGSPQAPLEEGYEAPEYSPPQPESYEPPENGPSYIPKQIAKDVCTTILRENGTPAQKCETQYKIEYIVDDRIENLQQGKEVCKIR